MRFPASSMTILSQPQPQSSGGPAGSAAATRRLFVAARTDIGRRREVNEDAVLVLSGDQADLPDTDLVFVVADGMGGMRAGDVASREAVRVVRESLERALRSPGADPRAALDQAIRQANDAVYALARGGKSPVSPDEPPTENLTGGESGESGVTNAPGATSLMGTTCVAGVVQEDRLFLAHVGDSRAYVLRGGDLHRLTRDHSFVEERVRAGDLSEEEARRSRFRNMITRASESRRR
jgi:protein phosphatase